jgi:hypothetical protein
MKPTKKQVIDLIKRYEKTFVESEEIKLAIEHILDMFDPVGYEYFRDIIEHNEQIEKNVIK